MLLLMRHTQSEYNLTRRKGGNPPLTAKGREQARAMAALLAGRHIDAIHVSPLRRSIETAQALREQFAGAELVVSCALCEIACGMMDSLTDREFCERFPDLYRARSKDKYHWKFPQGESYADVAARAVPLARELLASEQVHLVIAHKATSRAILAELLDLPRSLAADLPIPQDCIFELARGRPPRVLSAHALELPLPKTCPS